MFREDLMTKSRDQELEKANCQFFKLICNSQVFNSHKKCLAYFWYPPTFTMLPTIKFAEIKQDHTLITLLRDQCHKFPTFQEFSLHCYQRDRTCMHKMFI